MASCNPMRAPAPAFIDKMYWDEMNHSFPLPQNEGAKQVTFTCGTRGSVWRVECENTLLPKGWLFHYNIKWIQSIPFLEASNKATRCEVGKLPYYELSQQWNCRQQQAAIKKEVILPKNFHPQASALKFFDENMFQPADLSGITRQDQGESEEDYVIISSGAEESVNRALLSVSTSMPKRSFWNAFKRKVEKRILEETLWQDSVSALNGFIKQLSDSECLQGVLKNTSVRVEMPSILYHKDTLTFLKSEQERLKGYEGRVIICPICIKRQAFLNRNRHHAVFAIISAQGFVVIDSKSPFYKIPHTFNTKFQSLRDRSSCLRCVAYTIDELVKSLQSNGQKEKDILDIVKAIPKPSRRQLVTIFQ